MLIIRAGRGYQIVGPVGGVHCPDRSKIFSLDELAAQVATGIKLPLDYHYFARKQLLEELRRNGISEVRDTAEIDAPV
jgi:hypothetical protein